MKKNKVKEFGRTRIVVIVLLGLLGLIYLPDHTFLGLLLIIIALFTIIVDKTTNSQNNAKAKETVAEPKYNAEDFGAPMECPFCGKEIPSEVNYCFYCGRALQGYKKIEAVRIDSISRIGSEISQIRFSGMTRKNRKIMRAMISLSRTIFLRQFLRLSITKHYAI